MVSMKQSKQSNVEVAMPTMYEEPYPYGLAISLNEESLAKLGLDKLPAVGSVVMVHAKATVVRASINESLLTGKASTPERSLDLQITDMDLAPEKTKPPIEDVLYGKA